MKNQITISCFFKRLFLLFSILAFTSRFSLAQVNDDCSGAIPINPSPSCSSTGNNTAGTILAGTNYSAVAGSCLAGSQRDMWYSFVAESTSPTITVSTLTQARFQVYTDPCGTPVSVFCSTSGSSAVPGLTIGLTYFIRVYSFNNSVGNFSVCVVDPAPANNACASATVINSDITCTNISGTVYGSTNDGTSTTCGTGIYDVWYSFTAQTPNPTITLNNVGSDFVSPALQLIAGCGTASLACGTTSAGVTTMNATGLTIGNIYRIRVFSTGGTAPLDLANAGFNICVTDPAPVNNVCTNATALNSALTCINTSGTIKYADATSGIPACGAGNTGSADVWYSFVAQTVNPTITLSSIGATLRSTTPGNGNGAVIQLLSGSCGSLTSIGCVTGTGASLALNTSTIPGPPGLTIGTTYYIRVSSNNNSATTAGTGWGFNICITDPAPANNACASAINLTTNPTCINTTGTVYGATNDGTSTTCGTGIYDVWYSFVASTPNPTITMSNVGSDFISPALELITTCGSASIVCGTSSAGVTTLNPTNLVIGTTYRIRVFSTAGAAPASGVNAQFNICVTDPLPANDICTNAINLTSAALCSNTAGSLKHADATALVPACGAGNTGSADVWYSFVAQTFNPVITLSGIGTNLRATGAGNGNGAVIQLLWGTCGSFSSLGCVTGTGTSLTLNTATIPGPPGLTIGATYYIRISSNNNLATTSTPGWQFNICITDPAPSNNACASAAVLTSGLVCTPTTGSVYGATNDGISTACGTGVYDVWYSFVANYPDPTIRLNNIGLDFTSPALELMTTCGSASIMCGTAGPGTITMNPTGLIVGNTYRIRVFSTAGTAPTSGVNAGFEICITDPVLVNDACAASVLLTSSASCINTAGNLKYSNASILSDGVPPGCGDPNASDVWYRFVAQSSYPNIQLSNIGSSITNAAIGGGIRMQLLEGSCGSFSQIVCATGSYNTTSLTAGRTLVIGNTYYIRISTLNNVPGTPGAGNLWKFSICITDPLNTPTPRFGNSYVNISKRNSGGVVEKGDTLEIRMTIALPAGVVYYPRYVDNIPSNTQMLSSSNDSIRVITNEGLTYKSYTPLAGDDAATYIASPGAGEYNIRMNFGFGANMSAPEAPLNNSETDITGAKQMSSPSRPVGGGRLLFATSFRVKVTGDPGDIITLGAGKFLYRASPGDADQSVNTVPYQILVSNAMSLCANATGVNSAQEYGGTFGSGTTLNRPTPPAFLPTGYTYVSNVSPTQPVGDGSYAIVKNSSPRSGINRNASRKPNCVGLLPSADSCDNRMFDGHWFIDGDHSGTNDGVGNTPPSAIDPGGYMLMVNADYVASEVYRQDISGLCPNTYYEFSAWVRNICPNCGVDSIGTQTWRPGVNPNLTFILDNVDRYNTGEVDTLGGWIKKGFVFVTGPSQTSATFSIRNNGQGGGGNDWVMDDISVATCLPNMSYSPSLSPTVCEGNALTINDTIRSYFNNYRHHQWQRSTDNGLTWSDVGSLRDSIPHFNAALNSWEYITSYTIPPPNTNVSDSGNLYRVIVATSADNVSSPSCQVTDGISIINLFVIDCAPVLSTNLLSFNGSLMEDKTHLNWTTSKEDKKVKFNIERSADGFNFSIVSSVNGYNNSSTAVNSYSFIDPVSINNKAYYRIIMIDQDNKKKYSRVIQLSRTGSNITQLTNVINPFFQALEFDIHSPVDTKAEAELLDMFGKVVKKTGYLVHKGVNTLSIFDTGYLPAGAYVFRLKSNGIILSRKVLKRNSP